MSEDLKINEKFEKLIPGLLAEEFQALQKSIIKYGCREKIIVWQGYIIDGHHRYKICKELDIPFKTASIKDLQTETDVMIWMINTQLERRNISINERLNFTYQLKDLEQEQAKERQLAGKKIVREDKVASCDAKVSKKGKALSKIAKKAGTSTRTAERYDSIMRKGTDEQKEAVRSGQKKIGTVYKEIQDKENQTKGIQAKEKPAEDISSSVQKIKQLLIDDNSLIYLFLYSNVSSPEQGDVSNVGVKAKIEMCADCIMNLIKGKCAEDDELQLRLAMKRIIAGITKSFG